MKTKHVIFDLDGTLVDSSSDIVTSLEYAFEECGIKGLGKIQKSVVGPPLNEMIERIAPWLKSSDRARVVGYFKQYYDSIGLNNTIFFDGIREMLDELLRGSVVLSIATNKRYTPTMKILENLDAMDLFSYVRTIDSFLDKCSCKADLIKDILNCGSFNLERVVYVGDTISDMQASSAAGVKYIGVQWGYGYSSDVSGSWVESPAVLERTILGS